MFFILIGINTQIKAQEFFFNENVVSFCTEENDLAISFPAGTSGEMAFEFSSGCLGSTLSPQWFIMQIDEPGMLGITIEHSAGYDVDFACYGPFTGKNKQEVIKNINEDVTIYAVEDDYSFLDIYSPSDTCYPQSYLDEYKRIKALEDSISDDCYSRFFQLDYDDFASYWEYEEYCDAEYENFMECIDEASQKEHVVYPPDPVQFDITNPCFRGYNDNYPLESMVDCSYSTSSKEFCYIPDAKTGEWYLFLVTNYSQKPGTISFDKTSGSATTNCKIIVDAMTVGPVCEGESFDLDVNNAPENATFLWTGPNGFVSTEKNPTISNATQENAGIYTVVMVSNGVSSDEVEVPVIVNKRQVVDITKEIKEGESYIFGDEILTTSGEYQKTFTSEDTGCDSIVNLSLTVLKYDPVVVSSNSPVCEGDAISFEVINSPEDATFLWTGPNGFSSDQKEPVINMTTSDNAGLYSLVATVNGYELPVVETEVVITEKTRVEIDSTIRQGETISFNGQQISASGTYQDTLTSSLSGCDSIVTLNLKVVDYDPITITNNGPLCEGESLSFSVKNAPENAEFSWSGPNGFSSVADSPIVDNVLSSNSGTYSLTVTVNGTVLPTAETDVVVNEIKRAEISESIHQGESFLFNGQQISVSGTYHDTLTSSLSGCDSIVTLNLEVVDYDLITITNNGPLCEGESLSFSVKNAPKNATFSWSGPNGFTSVADSPIVDNVLSTNGGTYSLTITVNGTVLPTAETDVVVNEIKRVEISESIHRGESFLFNGQQISVSGTYQATLTSATSGCDSIVTLDLTVVDYDPIIITNNSPLCEGELLSFNVKNVPENATFSWSGPNGFASSDATPTVDNVLSTNSGTYSLIVTVNGTVLPTAKTDVVINEIQHTEITDSIHPGETFLFNGQQLSASGTYNNTLVSAISGCDSIVTLNLTVVDYDPIIITNNGPLCEGESLSFNVKNAPKNASFSWSGPDGFSSNDENPTVGNALCTNSGTYSLTVTVNGTVLPTTETDVVVNKIQHTEISDTILQGEAFLFNGQQISVSGTYQDTLVSSATGCDSIVTLKLFVEEIAPAIVSSNSPLCEGGNLSLYIDDAPEGVSYEWVGPNKFKSTEQNPTIDDVTKSNSGIYSVKYEYKGKSFNLTTPVVINSAKKQHVKAVIKGDETYKIGDVEYSEAGEYTVTLVSATDCDSIVYLTLTRAYEAKADLIPEIVFTPNSDGENDRWIIKNVELYSDINVTIYDRMGKIVREFNAYDNQENSWDGKDYRGRILPSTDYWYVIDVVESDKQYVGHVTLLH